MRKLWIFSAAFLFIGICYISEQDLVVLRNGNIIEAKVVEISSTQIKYLRHDNLDGFPVIANLNTVLSIKYETGTLHIVNPAPVAGQQNNQTSTATGQKNTQRSRYQTTAMDTDSFIFGINANAGGAIGYAWGAASGAGVNVELGKGKFNSEINLMLPNGGFGILATFNGFWPSEIGGFYLGGGIGFSIYQAYGWVDEEWVSYGSSGGGYYRDKYDWYTAISVPLGLNIGYKFVTSSGLYFRTGAFAGFDFFGFMFGVFPVYIKPDLAIGWTMR